MGYFIATLIIGYLIYQGWKAWIDPATQLGRQAAHMNWAIDGYVKRDGLRHTCYKRDGLKTMVDADKNEVVLLLPDNSQTFKDFVELENWLGGAKAIALDKSEYMRKLHDDGVLLKEFISELTEWPEDQAKAATHIVTSVLEKSDEDLDPYFGELTVGQIKRITEVISELTGTEPPINT